MLITYYIFRRSFDLYVVINYQKGGEVSKYISMNYQRLKAQLLPRVVLIIDHNICIIGLMCFRNIFEKSSKDAMVEGLCGDTP